MGFWKSFKAGLEGKSTACEYDVAGKKLLCVHCESDVFRPGEAQLNTAGATLIGLDWVNRTAFLLECTGCGYVHWFGKEPEPRDD